MVRRAEQIELVDVTPEALRRRMAHGNIYTADKIDASLSNYFRVGNLSALRELALLWLADRVEDALQRYQDEHEIDRDLGDARATDRRGERCSRRTRSSCVGPRASRRERAREIIAVHVVTADASGAPTRTPPSRATSSAEFEGTFHEIVDDDVATALVAFARSERGTQIIVGCESAAVSDTASSAACQNACCVTRPTSTCT